MRDDGTARAVRRSAARPGRQRFLLVAHVAIVAWGALAFGAVYPWAYTPLAVACAVCGSVALLARGRPTPALTPMFIGLTSIGLAIALQLVPLPLPVLARVSPGTDRFLRSYDFSYRIASQPQGTLAPGGAPALRRPISIAPERTTTGGLLYGALALFLLGAARHFSTSGVRRFVWSLIAFGAVLAFVGIAQRGLTAGNEQPLIYGFWKPVFASAPFGPFVNPNHFAGWMVMALPIGVGVFIDLLQRAVESGDLEGRRTLSFVSSKSFAGLVAVGTACLMMGLSLLMTRSRSGLAAFAVGVLTVGLLTWRGQSRGMRRAAATSALLMLLGATAWAGLDTIVSKFTETQGRKTAIGRLAVWRDTLRIVGDFPLTGSGLDTFGRAMVTYQSSSDAVHFQEAHNEYLQIAAEGGLLVGLPALATLFVFMGAVRQRFREAPKEGSSYCVRAGAVGGLAAIAVQSLAEFSLQMPGNAALFAAVCAVALHRSPHLQPDAPDRRGGHETADADGPRRSLAAVPPR